jgi:hypothetical protein
MNDDHAHLPMAKSGCFLTILTTKVRALSSGAPLPEGESLCVDCLAPWDGFHQCGTGHGDGPEGPQPEVEKLEKVE